MTSIKTGCIFFIGIFLFCSCNKNFNQSDALAETDFSVNRNEVIETEGDTIDITEYTAGEEIIFPKDMYIIAEEGTYRYYTPSFSRSENTDIIDGVEDYWYNTRYSNYDWVFGGYLSEDIPPEIFFDIFPRNMYIISEEGAYRHERPDSNSRIVSRMFSYAERITVYSRSENTDIIDGIEDYWYSTKSEYIGSIFDGWVFGGYLSNNPPFEVPVIYGIWDYSREHFFEFDIYYDNQFVQGIRGTDAFTRGTWVLNGDIISVYAGIPIIEYSEDMIPIDIIGYETHRTDYRLHIFEKNNVIDKNNIILVYQSHVGDTINNVEIRLKRSNDTWPTYYPPSLPHHSYMNLPRAGTVELVEPDPLPSTQE